MNILTLRTDTPEAAVSLYDGDEQLAHETWQAHRQLAETIHAKIQVMLKKHHRDWSDITGIVVYEGPGSFTGLRIGISVANALAYGLSLPVIGSSGSQWEKVGVKKLGKGQDDKLIVPTYGAPVHITMPRK